MSRSHRIEYLRWARAQAGPPWAAYNLILSGMIAPPAESLEMPTPDEMLGFIAADHPPLAPEIASHLGLPAAQVLVQPGTHYSIQLMLTARLEARPGPVVVEAPAYEALLRIPESLGAPILRLPRRRREGYALDLEALAGLVAQKPSVLLLSHPHNPSGAALSDVEIAALREFSAKAGCAILSDEVYLEFLDDPESRSLLHQIDGAVILRSFTKVFGLGGMRCSAIAGDRGWIESAIEYTDHGTVALAAPTHALALRVWKEREALWKRARATATRGRAVVAEWLNRVGDLMESPLFDAGLICFPQLRSGVHRAALKKAAAASDGDFGFGLDAALDSSHLWIRDLRRCEDVQLTPGAFFETPHAFRLGFGMDKDVLRGGLDRVEAYLRQAVEDA
jgi:aspartate/methionine/tyrosine aminotransferase